MKKIVTFCIALCTAVAVLPQSGRELLLSVRKKLEKVDDYEAKGKLKTNVIFIKAPVAEVKIFYKKPDKLKIMNETGISFIPKGSVNINLNKFLADADSYDVIDAGTDAVTGLRVLKLLPVDDQSEIVLSTLYIDEKAGLVRIARNTSRDNGTYELEMTYGKYAGYALPDKVIFSFNTKEYKLPKGVTFDYDTGAKANSANAMKNKKGKVEIVYSDYKINKGLDDRLFDKEK